MRHDRYRLLESGMVEVARAMRREMSESERVLWRYLRGDQLGVRVRRQHPFGPYILDFYVARLKLCIEVDGEMHDPDADALRDQYLAAEGIRTIRIPSLDLFDQARRSDWLEVIVSEIERRKSGSDCDVAASD